MPFPKPPFKLSGDEKKSDGLLIKYLKGNHFPFLRAQSKKTIARLKNESLRVQHDRLLDLWPQVLTDALKHLKMNDPREWDRKSKHVSYSSFFHASSLGTNELQRVFKQFAKFEGLLYGASPDRYRDHIAHPFRVWMVGHALLIENSCYAGKLFADRHFEDTISSVEWQCMWAITALCHDVGYPISHIERINALARDALQGMGLVHGTDLRFAFSQQMLPFHDTLIKMMASRPVPIESDKAFTTHLQNKYYLKFVKSFDNLDHGVVSALLISKALVYFLESDLAQDERARLTEEDARQFLIRREILRAIASHTCQDIYHLRFNSLAFLLYVVDEMQCWGRPTLEELQHDVAGIGKGDTEIRALNREKISVVIRTGEDKWSQDQYKAARHQLNKLYRMLRLGLGTAELKDRYLEFAIAPKSGYCMRLLLENGKISLSKVNGDKLSTWSASGNRSDQS